MDDTHKNGLYRWQRQTKPIVQSRSHRVTSTGEIHDWIKTVEKASTKATDVAFGLVQPGQKKGKALAQMHTKHVRAEEEAHLEAQELLSQWVTDKLHFDDDDGFDDLEAWRRARKDQQGTAPSKGATTAISGTDSDDTESARDILNNIKYDDDFEIDEAAIYERVKRSALGEEDPYAHLYDMDESEAVSSVLKTLLSKDVVKETFRKDLGFGDKDQAVPDPRTKMEMRHQMVKENREKRQKQEMKKLKDRQLKKEAKTQAQQMINKEQKDKDTLVRKEEEDIKKEMAVLRKELAAENKKKEENLRREREEKERIETLAIEELERQKFEEERIQIHSQRTENERRKNQRIKQEMWRTKQESKNLKCLYVHFSAWYDIVLSKRLLLGKVKAMSDWKVTVRVWGAWKSYVRGQRAQVSSVQHEKEVIEVYRKELSSQTHYQHRLLRKCLNGWKFYVKEETERREMEADQEHTKGKMVSLLNAIADGRIVNDKSKGSESNPATARSQLSSGRSSKASNAPRNRNHKNSDLFVQDLVHDDDNDDDVDLESHCSEFTNLTKDSRPSSVMSSVSRNSSRPTSASSRHGKRPVPMEAWQVTRQHTRLPAEDIRNIVQYQGGEILEEEDEEAPSEFTDTQIRKRFGTQPWMNRNYVVNNFEHRYTAQQRALKQQNGEIREQRRLIQDLQYQQQQQRLQQQLSTGVAAPDAPTTAAEGPPKGTEIPRDNSADIPPKQSDLKSQRETTLSKNTTKGGGGRREGRGGRSAMADEKDENQGNSSPSDGQESDRTGTVTQRTACSDVSRVSSAASNNTKYLQVLKNMDERAAQRALQKAERDERRRKQEEEKLAHLEKEEAERLKEIEEEKKAKVEAFRQKKRLERQKDEERHKEAARQIELVDRAKAHYERSILKYRGLLPLKKLISLSKRNWNRAVRHRNQSMMKQALTEWKEFTQSEIRRKNDLADQMGQFLMVKHTFDRWRKHKHHTEFLLRRADRHYETCLRYKSLHAWKEWVVVERDETEDKMRKAEEYYWHHLLRSRFLAWRFLPDKLKKEEQRKKRKMEMRQRVAELIPDFAPSQSVERSVDASQDFS